jgi:hypothetical protein
VCTPLGMVGFHLARSSGPMSIVLFGSSCLVRHAGNDRSLRALPSSTVSAANGRFLANAAQVRRLGFDLNVQGGRGASCSGLREDKPTSGVRRERPRA